MKKIYLFIVTLVITASVLMPSCAKRGSISGGAKDTLAPKIVRSFPENYSTNFKGKTVKIYFNELIKVKDINKQLIISPPLEKKPTIIPQGSASKFISVTFLDSLQPNTTYSLNFGQSITDNNEGNPYSQFRYVFSTGNEIDSLKLVGSIKDAELQKPDNFVSVQLYDAKTFTDSTVYKDIPLYVTNTLDSLKYFTFDNIKEGSYKIIALKDKNSNFKFDPKTDKIGFLSDAITLPNNLVYELELFKEPKPIKASKPTQETNTKFFMGYEGENPEKAKIKTIANGKEIQNIITRFTDNKKDSLQIFIPEITADSIVFSIEKDSYTKDFTYKLRNIKTKDSLVIDSRTNKNLSFRKNVVLNSNLPIISFDNSKISLFNKDSIAVPFKNKYDAFTMEMEFDFEKEENQQYTLQILPNALEDFYKNTNDTLTFIYNTLNYSDYGNLTVNVIEPKRFPFILEILTSNGEVIASAISTKETSIDFNLIEAKNYTLRIIYDDNKNGIWDTGNYLEKKQAEEIIYFPKEVEVRANWDVNQDF